MRRMLLTLTALATIFFAPALVADRASAMTTSLPAGMANALQDINAADEVALVCRRRCNWRGCFRRCWNTGPVVVYRPYRHRRWRAW